MYQYEDPASRFSVQQMNSELQEAQLELLTAHCATHQLGLHYSTDDLARFGRRDILRKSAQAASALNDFYLAVEKKLPRVQEEPQPAQPAPKQIVQAVEWLVAYLQQQHDRYFPRAVPLTPAQKARLWPFFFPTLLDRVRVVELRGERVAVPEFFAQVRAAGFEPPEITHMDSVTFLDVVVFNQLLNERALFHALVHAVQIELLGLERYAELWVQSFVNNKTHFTVPLEVHAFSLASKFLSPLAEKFSVEESVSRWVTEDRY